MPAPLRCLRERIAFDGSAQAPEWARFLPPRLRPAEFRDLPSAMVVLPDAGAGAADAGAFARHGEPLCAEGQVGQAVEDDGEALGGTIWRRSQEAHGCRLVQRAFDDAAGDAEREALAAELKGHVADAARCPHANHVLQKVVAIMRPQAVQFVIEEIRKASVVQIAKHKYGCRIVQRLVEHCYWEQVADLVDELLREVSTMSRHPYGNYVVQVVLQHGGLEQRRRIVQALRRDLRILCSEPAGCAVIGAALEQSDGEDRHSLAHSLLKEPGLLVFMASVRHGDGAIVRLLELLKGEELRDATARLSAELPALRMSKYGRQVAERLDGFRVGATRSFKETAARAGA